MNGIRRYTWAHVLLPPKSRKSELLAPRGRYKQGHVMNPRIPVLQKKRAQRYPFPAHKLMRVELFHSPPSPANSSLDSCLSLEYRTQSTSSDILSERVWTSPRFPATSAKSQNFTYNTAEAYDTLRKLPQAPPSSRADLSEAQYTTIPGEAQGAEYSTDKWRSQKVYARSRDRRPEHTGFSHWEGYARVDAKLWVPLRSSTAPFILSFHPRWLASLILLCDIGVILSNVCHVCTHNKHAQLSLPTSRSALPVTIPF